MGHKFPSKVRFENHGKLVIVPRAELEDSGKYMCKAKNPLGEVQHTFTVTVEGKNSVQCNTLQCCHIWFVYIDFIISVWQIRLIIDKKGFKDQLLWRYIVLKSSQVKVLL